MATVVIGATRGLGKALCEYYLTKGTTVYGTTRKPTTEGLTTSGIKWIPNVDIGSPSAGKAVVSGYTSSSTPIKTLIVSAGYFATESLEKLNWEAEETMYRTSSIGPAFLVSTLSEAKLLAEGSRVIMISSESGSITLRHAKEGGGNYGHHASKAALNMVTKLLSLDLKDKGVAVVSVHPGFMRTEMTKGVGFDKYWDVGGGKFLTLGLQMLC
jgi:NAD(P)-dependent dehydrogenase (short-subunit alcohol dehydrogenase family)